MRETSNLPPEGAVRFRLDLKSETETIDFAGRLASLLRPGDLVLLSGPLGAGKSTIARATIRALLGEPGLDVPSPTFLLVLPYEGRGRSILHADLYRIDDPREVDEFGLDEDPDAIVLVEWPDRDPTLAGRADLFLSLALPKHNQGRECELTVVDPDRVADYAELARTYERGGI